MNKIKVFFDTNVLIYAHDESSIYHENSANLLNLVFENQITGVIAEQNIIIEGLNPMIPDDILSKIRL
jgi:predicted nucleic acid-binding protein